jgi:hypothetical protein
MVGEYQVAADGNQRQAALMNAAQLLEKLMTAFALVRSIRKGARSRPRSSASHGHHPLPRAS